MIHGEVSSDMEIGSSSLSNTPVTSRAQAEEAFKEMQRSTNHGWVGTLAFDKKKNSDNSVDMKTIQISACDRRKVSLCEYFSNVSAYIGENGSMKFESSNECFLFE